jgi:hypothetical protein
MCFDFGLFLNSCVDKTGLFTVKVEKNRRQQTKCRNLTIQNHVCLIDLLIQVVL